MSAYFITSTYCNLGKDINPAKIAKYHDENNIKIK